MLVIGLTGGIGSGKSTVAELFSAHGVEVVDTDVLSREAVAVGSKALTAIADHFGPHVIAEDGSLQRRALRAIVFADAAERTWLEQLLHPVIAELLQQRIAHCQSSYCLLVSPLLLETSQRDLVDRVLVVDVPEEIQLQRTLQRDQGDEVTIRAIIAAQIDRQQRLAAADDIIDNTRDKTRLEARVSTLHNQYLELARQHT